MVDGLSLAFDQINKPTGMVAVDLKSLHEGSDGTDASDLKSWFKRI
jgi:hypothetical protein